MSVEDRFAETFISFVCGPPNQQHDSIIAIWTGWDQNRTYQVGDQLNWWPKNERPGVGIDAIYVSMGGGPVHLVAVADHKVAEVVPLSKYEDSEDPLLEGHKDLESRWAKSVPPRELWSDEVWAAQEERKKQIKKGVVRRAQ